MAYDTHGACAHSDLLPSTTHSNVYILIIVIKSSNGTNVFVYMCFIEIENKKKKLQQIKLKVTE